MAGFSMVTSEHPMLDVVDSVFLAGYIVVERLLFGAAHEAGEALEHATFRFSLVSLGHHLEEHVDVHALVDVEEEGDAFGRDELLYVHFLQLADRLDKGLIARAPNRNVHIEHLIPLFVSQDGAGVHLFHKADETR